MPPWVRDLPKPTSAPSDHPVFVFFFHSPNLAIWEREYFTNKMPKAAVPLSSLSDMMFLASLSTLP
ncbi:hypothetical protein NDU88_000270, partial [Pleurodeles waltl]